MTHLQLVASEVRSRLVRQLEKTDDADLLTPAPGLANHVAWHAGHCLWVAGHLIVEPLAGADELPAGWAETYGKDCRPPGETTEWASRAELIDRLSRQQARIIELLGAADADPRKRAALDAPTGVAADGGPKSLARRVVHALHDEASHQGEIQVLRKLADLRRAAAT